MSAEQDYLIAVRQSIREELAKYANEQIDEMTHKFRCKMGQKKNELIGAVINGIEIESKRDELSNRIQLIINFPPNKN